MNKSIQNFVSNAIKITTYVAICKNFIFFKYIRFKKQMSKQLMLSTIFEQQTKKQLNHRKEKVK